MQNGKSNKINNSPEIDTQNLNKLPGDPDCPKCKGIGYLRMDLPIDHTDFGKVELCSCRQPEIAHRIHERLFEMSNLNALQHLSFENFEQRGRIGISPGEADSLEQAFNLAKIYSRELKGWLLFQGEYGCGKTHLAAAIANFAVSMGVPTLFITVPDLLDTLRMAYSSAEITFEERFEQIRNAQLLILDDFGTQNATQWAQEKLFQIINYRYINKLATIVTTNVPLSEIEDRIRSRLIDPDLVTKIVITSPDYRNPAADMGYHKISIQAESSEMTFETFDLRKDEGLPVSEQKSLENAFRAAQEFADNPSGWLIINGTFACGKTHLAMAIANKIAQNKISPPIISIPKMLKYLRETFSQSSTTNLSRRFDEFVVAPILIVDDLGLVYDTPWVREQLFLLFDHRYRAKLPTVITTNEYMDDMDPRLLSRMKDTRLVKRVSITTPGYFDKPKPVKKNNYRRRTTKK